MAPETRHNVIALIETLNRIQTTTQEVARP